MDPSEMPDFVERLRAPFEKVLCNFGMESTIKITEVSDRWPLPSDETKARSCRTPNRLFDQKFKGRTYYALEVVYSKRYIEEDQNHLPAICAAVLITMGLGKLVVSEGEDGSDGIGFAVPRTLEVYQRLPLLGEAKAE